MFAQIPDEAFRTILEGALELAIDALRQSYEDGEDEQVLECYLDQTRSIFTRDELLAELKKLLAAHQSPLLYMPTDYHFLILYDVLSQKIDIHNDTVSDGVLSSNGPVLVGEIDFDWTIDLYFWDEDFLLDPDIMNLLPMEQKKQLGFTDETFGVVNRLKPHPDELVLKVTDHIDIEPACGFYKRGEPYPFWATDESGED